MLYPHHGPALTSPLLCESRGGSGKGTCHVPNFGGLRLAGGGGSRGELALPAAEMCSLPSPSGQTGGMGGTGIVVVIGWGGCKLASNSKALVQVAPAWQTAGFSRLGAVMQPGYN